MMTTALLHHFAAYDLWANHRYIDRLEQEAAGVLDQPVASSFPTLRSTMLHIRDAENVWTCRIMKRPYQWPAEASTELRTILPYVQRLHDLVLDLSDEDIMAEVVYADLRGNVHQQPIWQLLMHCFNHSTQHRGQLITMMRQLGLPNIPPNDLVVYQRQLKARM